MVAISWYKWDVWFYVAKKCTEKRLELANNRRSVKKKAATAGFFSFIDKKAREGLCPSGVQVGVTT